MRLRESDATMSGITYKVTFVRLLRLFCLPELRDEFGGWCGYKRRGMAEVAGQSV